MKIWILSSSTPSDSTSLLLEAARKRRIHCQIFDPSQLHFEISSQGPRLFDQGRPIRKLPDIILPRLGWKTLNYGLRLCHYFEAAGVRVLNNTQSLRLASDKLSTLLEWQSQQLPLPKTRFAISSQETKCHLLPGAGPTIFKLLKGSQGFGVTLAETPAQARAQVEAYRNIPVEFLAQEFLSDSRSHDVRAFVIGGKVIASMERQAAEGEFRSNLHQGGSALATTLTKTETALVLKAAKALGVFYSGVDFARTKKGPRLFEANPFPGFEGITQATGVDVASTFLARLQGLKN